MIKVKLAYDPYHMKTSLNINGQNIRRLARGFEGISKFIKQDIPLQSWLDPIPFQKWDGLLWEIVGNSCETEVEFQFKGRKMDFLDLQEAMLTQSSLGKYPIAVMFPENLQKFIYDDSDILERVHKAYSYIKSDEFKEILQDKLFEVGQDSDLNIEYQRLESKFQSAVRDNEFRIVFSGVYTCGKSTVINALLGKNLLPTRDGTCTSRVFKIQHDPTVEFAKMLCLAADGKTVVVQEEEYNSESLQCAYDKIFPRDDNNKLLPPVPPTVASVLISTDLTALYPEGIDQTALKLVLIDTPGTDSDDGNNAADGQNHIDITQSILGSRKKEIIVMVVPANEAEKDSIPKFLDMVDACDPVGQYDQRFFFVLNRADQCSTETPWDVRLRGVRGVFNGKKNRSIGNPRFYPTCAQVAYEIRSRNFDKYETFVPLYFRLDRRTRKFVPAPEKEYFHLDEICSTSQAIKNDIASQIAAIPDSKLDEYGRMEREIELHSGIVSLQLSIQDYIAKYAFPLKIQELLSAYETIFKETHQLVSVVSKRFEHAVRERKSTEQKKETEEASEDDAASIKDSLDEAGKVIQSQKDRLDAIIRAFSDDVKRQTDEIKQDMAIAISEAKKAAKSKATNATIKAEIKKIVDNAAEQCQIKVDEHFAESRLQTQKLEEEVRNFFVAIKEIIDFGSGFRIDSTTDFQKLSTKSILDVQNTGHQERNPKLDEGFFLWRPIKNLLFVPDKKIWVDDGIDLNELNDTLASIVREFNLNADKTFGKSLSNLTAASDQLKANLDALEEKINDYAERLERIRANIKDTVSDLAAQTEYEQRLENYQQLLRFVQEYTQFVHIDEE